MSLHLACILKVSQKTSLLHSRHKWQKLLFQSGKWVTRLINKRRFLQRHFENYKGFLVSSFYFINVCEFVDVLHEDNINFCATSGRIFPWLHIFNKGPRSMTPQKIIWSRFLILLIFRSWRRITTSSFLLEEYALERGLIHNAFVDEQLLIFVNFMYSTLLKRHPTSSI